MKAIIDVYLKDGVLDPQGKAIHHELDTLKFNEVKDVRVNKQFVLLLDEEDENKAKNRAKEMCETILANPVIEDYNIKIIK